MILPPLGRNAILACAITVAGGCSRSDSNSSTTDGTESPPATTTAGGAPDTAPPPPASDVYQTTPAERTLNTPGGRADYAYTLLLAEIVTPDGFVRYDRFDNTELVKRIGLVVRDYAKVPLPDDPKARLAYWCNAYNANVLFQAMMERAKPGFTSVLDVDGFFDARPITVAGEPMNLNFLENERIRSMDDPRIHAALVCAALSCPPLRDELFVADRIDEQLDDQCRRWVNDTTKNRIEEDTLLISEIFNWYGDDFEDEAVGGVTGFLKRYADPDGPLARFLETHPEPTIEWMPYDWALNQAAAD